MDAVSLRVLVCGFAGLFFVAIPTALAAAGPGDGAAPDEVAVGKKGACLITVRQRRDDWQQRVAALNVAWHYSWGADRPVEAPAGVEFVPMIWGWYGDERAEATLAKLKAQREAGTRTHLLGFNEPDGKKQANLSVERAIEAWPQLEATGLRLGSPAGIHADRPWVREFMTTAEDKGLRVDFVTVHWYGGTNAQGLIDHLKKVHALYGKPIWITEFAPADWNAKTRAENRHTPEQVLRFMKQVLPMLDELAFVERYAWFSAAPSHKALGPAALFDEDGGLTELGRYYAAHDSKPAVKDGTEAGQ